MGESSPKRISSTFANKKNVIAKTAAAVIALALWHLLAVLLNSKLLLVTPWEVLQRAVKLMQTEGFFSVVSFSLVRILSGFLSGLALGTVFALLAGRFKWVEYLLWPYMHTIKTVPVASFVVLALLWVSSVNLSYLIALLMVLPVVYNNLLEGIRAVDDKMLEMADVFKMSAVSRLRYIRLPALKPFALLAVRISMGLAWKAGIAAELIGYPNGSVGEKLYYSKIFINTADVFAWTLVIVILALICEKLLVLLVKKIFERLER